MVFPFTCASHAPTHVYFYKSVVWLSTSLWTAVTRCASILRLNGSYEALKGGSTTEAMEDLTGGVTETIALEGAPKNLFNMMLKSLKKGALMGCTIEVKVTATSQVQQKYHCRDARVCLTAQCAERTSDTRFLVQTERLRWHLHARAASPFHLPSRPTCTDRR